MKQKIIGSSKFRETLRQTMEDVYDKEMVYIITRPHDENVVLISEKEYQRLLRAKNDV